MKSVVLLLVVALFLVPQALRAGSVRCAETVSAQLQGELDELHSILQQHHSGHFVDGRLYGLHKNDFDDVSNLTIRQRQIFRKMNPHLGYPSSGPIQYPRMAYELLYRMDYQNTVVCRPIFQAMGTLTSPVPYGIVLANVNVTNNNTPESEEYLAIDPTNANIMVGASNTNVPGPGGQMMYQSLNGGSTWAIQQLTPTLKYHSDPWVNFNSTGIVYTATLDYSSAKTQVKFYKSTDHGTTYPTQLLVDYSSGNDKESAAIDYQTNSSCKDTIYAGFDNGKAQYISATNPGTETFRTKIAVQSSPSFSIAGDIAVGPPSTSGAAAPVYYAWTNTGQKAINFSKSTNCGATWSAYKTIATTKDAYDYGIPAQCNRRVLIYPSIDVDRSTTSGRSGWIYVAWNDFTAAQNNGCASATAVDNANVWFSRSTDGGNTWSTPKLVHSNPPSTDQFNQWLRVDDSTGTIHISWHDTRNDPNRTKTDIYYTNSTDGGNTFAPETKITTEQTDESTAGASPDQYGDYEGIAVKNGCAYPFWTDRRPSSGTDEEVFTNKTCP